MRARLDALLTEMDDDRLTRFVWLRQFDVGANSAAAVRLLERLEFVQNVGLSPVVQAEVPPHRITRLRRQGERYFADGLRDTSGGRRLAILAVCVVQWKAAIADAVVETHDRIVGKAWREAKQLCDARIDNAKTRRIGTYGLTKRTNCSRLVQKGICDDSQRTTVGGIQCPPERRRAHRHHGPRAADTRRSGRPESNTLHRFGLFLPGAERTRREQPYDVEIQPAIAYSGTTVGELDAEDARCGHSRSPNIKDRAEVTSAKKTSPVASRIGARTPMTARVLAQTGGWPAIIREEYDWLIDDEARARAATQRHRANQAEQ